MLITSPHLPDIPRKIISVVPSQTELLHYLGADVAGITKFCIHPEEWFHSKIRVGGTKALNIEKINEIAPDLIIANKEENVKEQIEELAEYFPVWLTEVDNLEDSYKMISDIGILTNTERKASELVTSIQGMLSNLAFNDPVPAAYLIWKDPYMTVGYDTFIHDMLEKAGYLNVFSGRKRYPEITVEDIRKSECRVVMLSSEPYPFAEKHITALQEQLPGKKIILVDGEMFSWYGSRLLRSAAYFKKLQEEVWAI